MSATNLLGILTGTLVMINFMANLIHMCVVSMYCVCYSLELNKKSFHLQLKYMILTRI